MRQGIRFRGQQLPATDFEAVRDQLRTPLLWFEVDLASARPAATPLEVNVAGANSFYVDLAADVGNATLIFAQDDGVRPAAVYVRPGFIARVTSDRLFVYNDAQAGKVLRVVYGTDIDFMPGVNTGVNVSGEVSNNALGLVYATAFRSSALMAANTAETVVAAGSNTAGLTLWSAGIVTRAGVNSIANMQAHTAASTTTTTGDVILGACAPATLSVVSQLPYPLQVDAGKGLYFLSDTLETAALRWALYTLN